MRTPTSATGIYANWDGLDVDGDGVAGEDPWVFGSDVQFPVLSYAGLDAAAQFAAQPPDFGAGTVPDQTARTGLDIQAFEIPAATHPNGGITYSTEGLPPGMSFDADGSGACGAARTVCGAPTRVGTFEVTILATNADGSARASLSFTITVGGIEIDADPDTAPVDAGPLALNENPASAVNAKSYRLRLSSAPSAAVTVRITSADRSKLKVDDTDGNSANGVQNTLSFTASNWSAWQTVTARALLDDDDLDETLTLSHAASGGGYDGQSATLTVNVEETKVLEVLVDANPATAALDPGPLLLDEASALTKNYLVKLSHTPSATVTVALASDNSAVTLSPSPLIFSATSWSTAQTVAATTTTDADAVDEAADVTHSASGATEYAGVSATLRVGVRDAQRTGTDYDADEDGLIEIDSLAKLNAMRWDLDGDGTVSAGNASNYSNAFPGASTGMGCPDRGDADDAPEPCAGYELTRDLDFDTDGSGATHADGVSDANDAYHNGGSGWDPIGPDAAPSDNTHFNATFDGNGHLIRNLFINRPGRSLVGLFAVLRTNAAVYSLGLPDAWLNGNWSVSPLAGESWGRMAAVWSSGAARGLGNVGGLAGVLRSGGTIVASYSTASAACTGTQAGHRAGGLVGLSQGANDAIATSYATGAATGACPTGSKTGLTTSGTTIVASYWDTDSSGIQDDTDDSSPEGRTRSQLQAPTEYGTTGLYAAWDDQDVNNDGIAGGLADDAWYFGTPSQHPVLKFGGLDTAVQFSQSSSLPSFGSARVTQPSLRTGLSASLSVPAAIAASGAIAYSAIGLPPGMSFDADGRGACGTARAICGRPTRAGLFAVTVWASNAEGQTPLRFVLSVGGIEIDADADTPQFDSGPAALAENPGAAARTKRYRVRLTSAPNGNVRLTVASSDTGALRVDADPAPGNQNRLAFTTANWSTAQTLWLHSVQDEDGADERVTITHRASGGGYNGQSAPLEATVEDDEPSPALVLDANPATPAIEAPELALSEAGSDRRKSYTLRLSVRPRATVRVAVTSSDRGAAQVNRSQLSFSTGNWNRPQTVQVTAQSDGDTFDERLTVAHAASGAGEYAGLSAPLAVLVQDDGRHSGDHDQNDNDLIDIHSLAQLNALRWDLDGDGAASSGNTANYRAAFSNAQSGMGCPNGCKGYELRNDLDFDTDGDGDVDADDPGSYPNWAPIGGTYTATFDGNGHIISNLRVSASDEAGLFHSLTGTIRGLGLRNANVATTSTSSSTLVGALAARVNAGGEVLACWSSGTVRGPSAGGLIGSVRGGRVAASFSTATVHGENAASTWAGGLVGYFWNNAKAVAVYATGTVNSSNYAGGLIGTAGGSGAELRASYAIATVNGNPSYGDYGVVGSRDNSGESFTNVVWGGAGANSAGCTPVCGPKRSASDLQTPTSATGIYANWSNLDVDGDGTEGENPWDFGESHQYPALRYPGLDTAMQFPAQGPALPPTWGDVPVAVPGFQLGHSQTFQAPAALRGSALTYTASGLPPGLIFDADGSGACGLARAICGAPTRAGTWSVRIQATNADGSASLSFDIAVGGLLIDAIPSTPEVDAGSLRLQEHSTFRERTYGDYSVRLSARPSAATTVLVASSDPGAATVDASSTTPGLQDRLVFSAANWNTAHQVRVRAVQDEDPVDERLTISNRALGSLLGTAFLTVTVEDDEPHLALLIDADPSTPAIDRGPLLLQEGAAQGEKYLVKLPQAPSAAVTVAVTSGSGKLTADAGAASGIQTWLRFSTRNWNSWQTVTARAAADADAVDEATSIAHIASGAAEYAGVSTRLRVGIRDGQRTGTDYDRDEDGLIEIDSLTQLNALRWDLDGDGAPSEDDRAAYSEAFPGASAGMGCADGADNDLLPDCVGYELRRNLDFYNDRSYANWEPFGAFTATFDGNGFALANLTHSSAADAAGLFAEIGATGLVRGLGLLSPNITAAAGLSENGGVGALAGINQGTVAACYAVGGSVASTALGGRAGGLVGWNRGALRASYADLAVGNGGRNDSNTGGLVGYLDQPQGTAAIVASYARGTVDASGSNARWGGLLGNREGSTGILADSYWDKTRTSAAGFDVPSSLGKTSSELQTPVAATGIYANWDDLDIDGDGVADLDFWDFGESYQYPVLRHGGFDPAFQFALQRPDFGSAALPPMAWRTGIFGTLQVPSAGSNLSYQAVGLPPGLQFDIDGRGACGAARTICGAPTQAGTFVFAVRATSLAGLTASLSITLVVGGIEIDADPSTPWVAEGGPLELAEDLAHPARSKRYTVRLTSAPTGPVTLSIANPDPGALALGDTDPIAPGLQNRLLFSPGNWNRAQTLSLQALADADAADERVALSHAASGGGYDGQSAQLVATVADDQRPALLLDANPATAAMDSGWLDLEEASAQSKPYLVRLATPPTAGVTVAISSADPGAATVRPAQLRFTPANWQTAQTATASAVADADGNDEQLALTHAASGGGYAGVQASQPLLVWDGGTAGDYDDDNNGLIEIDRLAQLNALRWDPDGDGRPSSAAAADQYAAAFPEAASDMGCLNGCEGYELRTDLDFDTDGDGDVDGRDPGSYPNWTPLGSYLAIFDGGGHVIANLTIHGSPRQMGLFRRIQAGAVVRGLGLHKPNLHSTSVSGWSGSDFSGALAAENNGAIIGCYVSGGRVYHGQSSWLGGLVGINRGTVRTSYSTATVENPTNGGHTGGLVAIQYAPGSVRGSYFAGRLPAPDSSSDGLLVGNLIGGSIANSYGDRTLASQTALGGAGANRRTTTELQTPTDYDGIYASWDEYDGDAWDFGTSQQYPVLKYGGFDTARQFSPPPSPSPPPPPSFLGVASPSEQSFQVGVFQAFQAPAASRGGAPTYSAAGLPPGLQFDADGSGACGAPRTICGAPTRAGTWSVTVRATNADGSASLSFSIRVEGILIDTDPGTPQPDAGPLALEELSTSSSNSRIYSLWLSAQPSATTTVSVASGDPGAATVDASTASGLQSRLLFSTANWSTAQTVTVRALRDDDALDERLAITHRASGGQQSVAALWATVDDDEPFLTLQFDADPSTPAIIDPGPLLLEEGLAEGEQYAVRLPQAPTASVVVTLAEHPLVTADASAAPGVQNQLVFTARSWNTWQTLTATAAEDEDAADDLIQLAHLASGAAEYAGAISHMRIAVRDDERRGTDYDRDEDGLIEIDSLAQLDIIRWDLDGDGRPAGNRSAYRALFPGAAPGMGCPDSADADRQPDPCQGYELTAHLNFDTDGDGDVDAEDPGSFPNWTPIGGTYSATFDGNGFAISNLTHSSAAVAAGLFAQIGATGLVRGLGLVSPNITAGGNGGGVGALAGVNQGAIAACYAVGGSVSSTQASASAGGLVGWNRALVRASYADVAVGNGGASSSSTGGLAGVHSQPSGRAAIVASYARGTLDVSGSNARSGGLVGDRDVNSGVLTDSYWDKTRASAAGRNVATGLGKTSSELQTPTAATGIYANWDDLDIDGDGLAYESPWIFGASNQYPVLGYGGFDPALQRLPDFSGGVGVTNRTARTGVSLSFYIPTATHAGAIAYRVTGLPPGMSFDADGTGACSTALRVCGAPTRVGTFEVTVWAATAIGVRSSLTFTITVGGIEIDADASTPATVDAGPLALSEDPDAATNTRSYAVRLTSAPSATMTVTAASADAGAVTVDTSAATGLQSRLSFTTSNWSTWQTVTARAVQDVDARNESTTLSHAASGGGYNGQSAPLAATVIDDDDELLEVLLDADPSTPALDPGPLLLDEASARSKSYRVLLAQAPAATVTLTLASDNSTVTLDQAALSFTPQNWNTAQTVTAMTERDANAVDEASDLRHSIGDRVSAILRVGVSDAQRTGTDYDADEDGLIEIDSLDKFNAMRWDLDGNGQVSSGDSANYENAFPGASAGMGCPDGGDANQTPDACVGYELISDLDFDTNDSGGTYTGPSTLPVPDPGDAYYNSGGGWAPIGARYGARFNTTFDGNGHVISNLYNSRSAHNVGVFSATGPAARIVNPSGSGTCACAAGMSSAAWSATTRAGSRRSG